mmetsp:Transcript_12258/g.14513  ORF Transcript_12258/g.14513 Transcript_12258/m.14513 type:complete len:229 (+) Transcript_12258:77-763(+)
MPEAKKSPKKGMSKEVLDRLTKPVVKKKPKDMDKDCTFTPYICEASREMVKGKSESFHQRVDKMLELHEKAMKARLSPKPRYSFKPAISPISPELQAKLEKKGDFFERAKNDIETRKKKAAALDKAATSAFSFQPAKSNTPAGVKIEGTFLDRVAADVAARKNRTTADKTDPECKFKPEISKKSQKIMKENSEKFESRMSEDLEKRRQKLEDIKKELAKPPKFGKKKK